MLQIILFLFFQVMEKLRELFSGYSDFPPLAFILCGHFLSCPAGQSHIKELKGILKKKQQAEKGNFLSSLRQGGSIKIL